MTCCLVVVDKVIRLYDLNLSPWLDHLSLVVSKAGGVLLRQEEPGRGFEFLLNLLN